MLFSQMAVGSFDENSKRYLSPRDMFLLLEQKLPVMRDKERMDDAPQNCWAAGVRNQTVTGASIPALGKPSSGKPTAGFVRWWGTCVEALIELQNQQLVDSPKNKDLWARYFNPSLRTKLKSSREILGTKWKDLSEAEKNEQIRFLVEDWIGPDPVIKDLGFASGLEEVIARVRTALPETSNLNLLDANRRLGLAIMLREEFLVY